MIIDFHTHIFPEKIAAATVSALSKSGNILPHASGSYSGLLESMDKNGIDFSVNLPVLTKPSQLDSVLNFALNLNKEQKRIISFCGFHPHIEDYEKALLLIKEQGFLGIKIHPDYQGTFFDDQRYVRALALAKELDLITVTHAGVDSAFLDQEIKCTPTRVLRLLDKIGGYDKLVLAHLGGNQLFDSVYNELAGENLYFDTSYVLPFLTREQFERVAVKHGCEKILFATDSPWQNQGEMVSILKSYCLGKDAEEKILSENARKLLNI